jgi:hypothetical protein
MDIIDNHELREKLRKLGAVRLANALAYLCLRTEGGTEYVEALLLSPEEATKLFKSKLAGLKRRRKYIDWRAVPDFARELELILAILREGVNDPKTGLELVGKFFSCDGAILERSDDSSGLIGDVFRYDARNLFVTYASRCKDKRFVSDLLLSLYKHDNYGVRTELVAKASEFLPQKEMRALASEFWQRASVEPPDSYEAGKWWIGVEFLARQLEDPGLFEKAKLTANPELSSPTCMEIAQVYLDNDDPETALLWMERISPTDRFRADAQDQLLYSINEQLGDRESMAEIAWRMFRNRRSRSTLDMLLQAVGEFERERVIEEQVKPIMASATLSYDDAAFLVDMGRLEDASEYLFWYRDQLDGNLYQLLLPLAKALEKGGCFLGATLVYRSLLESILERAQSRYYHHGIGYLKKLDVLSASVKDWRSLPSHQDYKQSLLELHGRKRSFWSKYGL